MKVTIKTESLLHILNPLQPIINDNHVVPVLQNVKLEFTKKKLLATGNNLEVVCTNSIDLVTENEDAFCVNYQMLLSIVKSVPDKEITLSADKKKIDILHSKGNFNLPIESAKEFPNTEIEKFTKKAKVKGTAFRSALRVANKFILNDDLDAMANISLDISKKVFVRSTDRNRLFEEKIKGEGDEQTILISGKSSLSLSALLEDIKDDVEMVYNDNSIFFSFDNKEIMVVQQQGKFPIDMFKKIIATIKDAERFKIDAKQFLTALKRVSIMSAKEKGATVKLELSKDKVLITCESESFSTKAKEQLDVKFKDSRVMGFNYKYLIEILSIFEGEPELYLDSRNFLFITFKKKTGAIAPVMLTASK